MAKQKNNIIMRNTRGMVGGQIVFKRRGGSGYVSAEQCEGRYLQSEDANESPLELAK